MLEYTTTDEAPRGLPCDRAPGGGLPVDLWFKDPSNALVRWMPFGPHLLVEPFFFQTIAALKRKTPTPRESVTDLGILVSQGGALPDLKPAGIIFHLGRCGSTMLSNALRTTEGAVVLSEAPIFDSICRPPEYWRAPAGWERLRSQLLNSTVRIFGYHQHVAPRVVLKATTLSMFDMPLIRMVWPDVPAVVVVRDPVEIMMSYLQRPASFLLRRSSPTLLKVFGWQKPHVDRMTIVEYYGRHLGRLCEFAGEHITNGWRVIDYEQLSAPNICSIADLFNLDMPPHDSTMLEAAMLLYSKDSKRTSPFKSDRESKQRAATELVRDAVRCWAEGPYLALRSLAERDFRCAGQGN